MQLNFSNFDNSTINDQNTIEVLFGKSVCFRIQKKAATRCINLSLREVLSSTHENYPIEVNQADLSHGKIISFTYYLHSALHNFIYDINNTYYTHIVPEIKKGLTAGCG